MGDEKNELSEVELGQELARQQAAGHLLELNLASLSETQRAELAEVAARERLKLDASQRAADQRYGDSSRDLVNTVKTVEALEGVTAADFDVESRFETASGTTRVRVKKTQGLTVMIVAILLVLVLAVVALRSCR